MINAELRKWDIIYNDTKNFGQRVSAKIIDNDLHVFAEKYNYDLPLFNEYYVMDYSNGKYKMLVSHYSIFMKLYLSDEEYYKKYGNVSTKIIQEYSYSNEFYGYSSLASVPLYDATDENHDTTINDPLLFWRRQYYLMLKQAIDELIEKLKIYKECIADISEYTKCEYDIISLFNAEKEFQCVCKYDQEKIVIRLISHQRQRRNFNARSAIGQWIKADITTPALTQNADSRLLQRYVKSTCLMHRSQHC